jgi:hypothetical protein
MQTIAGAIQPGEGKLPRSVVNQSNVFIKPFLHQLMSQSAVKKPSLKPQTASNAGVVYTYPINFTEEEYHVWFIRVNSFFTLDSAVQVFCRDRTVQQWSHTVLPLLRSKDATMSFEKYMH